MIGIMKVWSLLIATSLFAGCLPYRFDRELWQKKHSVGREADGVEVSLHIDGDLNYNGARDVGDKRVLVGVSSKKDRKVELGEIVVRSEKRNLYQFDPRSEIPMVKHELAEQWGGSYRTDAVLKFGADVSIVYVDAFVRINDGPVRKVTSRFERDAIQGIHKVRLTEL